MRTTVRFDAAELADLDVDLELDEGFTVYADTWFYVGIGGMNACVHVTAEQAHEIAEAWRRIELAILERIHGPEVVL